MSSIDLYKLPRVIMLTLGGGGIMTMNLPLNRTDFNLFKGIQNQIEFYVKDNDRIPVNTLGKTLIFRAIDIRNNKLIFERELIHLDDLRGNVQLKIFPTELDDWLLGTYSWTITIINEEGIELILYADRNYNALCYFEVQSGPTPPPTPSIIILPTDFTSYSISYGGPTRYSSGSYRGPASNGENYGNVIATIQTTNWYGTVWFQANIDNSPSNVLSEWFDAELENNNIAHHEHHHFHHQHMCHCTNSYYIRHPNRIEFFNYSGLVPVMFTGNYMWLKVIYEPSDAMTIINGSLDKILLRA